MLQRKTSLTRTGGPARRTRGLAACSSKMRAGKAAQRVAYASADDAGQDWCSVCGRSGPTEHSHIYPQGMYKQHRNDPRNWLQVGKFCDCHRLFEHNKALFAKKYPAVWLAIIERMQTIDLKAYDFYAATNPLLYPD